MGRTTARVTAIAAIVITALAGCGRPEPAALSGEQIVVVGDSYTTGLKDDGNDPNVWPAMVWKELSGRGYDIDPTVSGEGGAGYARQGYLGHTFADKANAIRRATDLMVFFGSANDMDTPAAALPEAVRSTLAKARSTTPNADLLVIGPAWPRPDVPTEVWRVRDIVRDEAAKFGATFVDPLAERWLWNGPGLIDSDGIHPNLSGQRYLAEKIRPVIEAALSPSHSG